MKKELKTVLVMILLAQPAFAEGITFGVGVAGGLDYPIVQDDQSQGTVFGLKGRFKTIPAIALEPNLYFTNFGDPPAHEDFTNDIGGSKITAYGIDATLGAGFGDTGVKPYGVFGAGFYKVKRDQTHQDKTDFGWSAGFGIEFGATSTVGIDVRGKLAVIPTDGGASRKSASVTGGLNYYFGNRGGGK